MRHIPLAAPGFLGELFWLLAHPTTAVFAGIGLAGSFAQGFALDHILPQLFLGLLVFHGIAQAQVQGTKVKVLLLGWTLGFALVAWGSWSQYQSAGQVDLIEGQGVESYQRGFDTPVDFHLGQALTLSKDQSTYQFQFGRTQKTKIDQNAFLEGQGVEVGPWTLSYLSQKKDVSRLAVNLTVTPRSGTGSPMQIQLGEGESRSPDGQTSITVLAISLNRQRDTRLKNVGAGVKLLIRWADGYEQAWHYLDMPPLHSMYGQAPLKVQLDSFTPKQTINVRVQRTQNTLPWLWLGLILLMMSYGFGVFIHFSKPNEAVQA